MSYWASVVKWTKRFFTFFLLELKVDAKRNLTLKFTDFLLDLEIIFKFPSHSDPHLGERKLNWSCRHWSILLLPALLKFMFGFVATEFFSSQLWKLIQGSENGCCFVTFPVHSDWTHSFSCEDKTTTTITTTAVVFSQGLAVPGESGGFFVSPPCSSRHHH